MDNGEGYLAKEGLPTEPEHGGAVLPHAPEDRRLLELGVCFPDYIYRSILESVKAEYGLLLLKDEYFQQGENAKYYSKQSYD